jgi:glycosyl transferase family 1
VRILVHSVPPWAHSGYGTQCAIAIEQLAKLGHNIAVSAYAGVHEERLWRGIPVMGTGGKPYGNGVIAGNYRRWNADLVITLCDPWTLEPSQFAGLNMMPWMPVDCEPLSRMEEAWLRQIPGVRPAAMSQFGRDVLDAAGWPDAPVVPLVAQPEFRPDADAGRRWRAEMQVPSGAFLVIKLGVNNEDDRKAFIPTLVAFADFARRNHDAFLYLHTEAQAKSAPNLALAALDLGLKGRVAFGDEYKRACDLYSADWLTGMYNAADVTDAATKSEGFGVPIVESLACGTPVIGTRNSAVTEKIEPEWGWLVRGQLERPRHHQAWWSVPRTNELEQAYIKAGSSARSMRRAAEAAGSRWTPAAMGSAWAAALSQGS